AAPSGRMRRHGLRPCFAADSVVATSGDLFEEARVGLLLDRYENSLAAYAAGGAVETMTGRLTAREALEAVTTVAAGCCWLDGELVDVDTDGIRRELVQARDRLYAAASFNDIVPS